MKVIDHPKFGRCYELTDKEDIALLPRFGERSAENIVAEIENKKKISFSRFLLNKFANNYLYILIFFKKITLKNLPLINTLSRHQEVELDLRIKKKLRLIWNSKWFHTFAPEYKRKNLN